MYDIVCIIAAAVVFAFVVEVVFLSWIICWVPIQRQDYSEVVDEFGQTIGFCWEVISWFLDVIGNPIIEW